MMKITAKQNVGLDTTAWTAPHNRRGKLLPVGTARDDVVGSAELGEYLDWVAWLDDLARRAGQGQDEEARQLALAKLRFLLRRVQHLREQMMNGGRGQAKSGLERLSRLVDEWVQVVQELTGRQPDVVDDWPLPYRLYSRQVAATPLPQPGPLASERRRRVRSSGNMLLPQEQQVAWLVLHGIRFLLALVGEGFGMTQHPILLQIKQQLARVLPLLGPEQAASG
ncbi:hypothetical protein DLM_0756 [Aquitalea magnusonii]|uniref:Uncharacterized protein n=1 Tax=Aquitalea magnusonii TaxID=332411 RepID=A0A3G9G8W9_9NEIS|nr:hypothetical protein [Aquitalea magnusonii]BBF84408.1 hypothetical protein DLM_0756 [Aquitalea magnusonii]